MAHIEHGRGVCWRSASMYAREDEGEMLRHLTLDPTKIYQAIGGQKVSTMS